MKVALGVIEVDEADLEALGRHFCGWPITGADVKAWALQVLRAELETLSHSGED